MLALFSLLTLVGLQALFWYVCSYQLKLFAVVVLGCLQFSFCDVCSFRFALFALLTSVRLQFSFWHATWPDTKNVEKPLVFLVFGSLCGFLEPRASWKRLGGVLERVGGRQLCHTSIKTRLGKLKTRLGTS